jgi:RNA polymerase sigma-70 factor (sigma-E family)
VERYPQPHARSADSLRGAYESHATALFRLCLLLAGKEGLAEDLLQEAFTRAAPALGRLEASAVLPYLRATVLNLWRNQLRRRAIEQRLRLQLTPPSEVPFEQRDAMWRAIRRLPPRQRTCLVLRYYEDLTERETAKAMGCSIGTVKSQTSKALLRLRREFAHGDRG